MKTIKSLLLTTAAVASLAAMSTTAHADEVKHVVTSDDTLTALSLKYFGDLDHVATIANQNDLDDPNMIYDGTTLVIDTDAKVETSTKTASSKEASTSTEDTTSTEATDASDYSGTTLTMESTAYSSDPADTLGGGTVTATGQNLLENPMAVAVDPSVIPLGTRLYVEGYGEAIASDTGGAIKGNIIDVHFPTNSQAEQWGRRTVKVTILD
ncbi:3D domain-containing protein [Enterococcus sp.]|uniref:3D domain-containing protein n=1 Tax=Enterococcus sp. TaxID=35783 RepID=UPI0028A82902|nr:3D domain-containing protein [Enterococcus sp.]